MDIHQACQNAADLIIADMSDRRGLRHEWDQIDPDIRAEIRRAWQNIILQTMTSSDAVPNPLAQSIAEALNRHSAENGSNTPDFILADFLMSCLAAFDATQASRNRWYGKAEEAPGKKSVLMVENAAGSVAEVLITQSLATLSQRSQASFEAATTRQDLQSARTQVLGKDGEFTAVLQSLAHISAERRRELGHLVNKVRAEIDSAFEARLSSLVSV